MNFLSKMERKYGRFAIPNLTMYIIGMYVIGYIIELLFPSAYVYLTLEPYFILRGQVWRLITWLLIPPSSLDFFTIIMLLLYYQLGTSLEQSWGSFRYNLYMVMGLIFTVIGAFVAWPINGGASVGGAFSTYYINMSIFLAFAASYPNMELMLYFIIPIKIKWMGILYGVFILVSFFQTGLAGKVAIIASLLNFIIFFFMTKNMKRVSPKEIRRKQNFKRQVNQNSMPNGVTKHKCAVCGRTELDGEHLEFRFCSKCDGNYEYCQDHLFTHQHIKRP